MMEFVLLFPCGTGANAPMRLIRDCRSFMVHHQSFTWRTPHGSLPSVRSATHSILMVLFHPSICRISGCASGAGAWMSALPDNICPRPSERGNLPTYNATKWKTGCTDCRPAVWLRPPATVFWRSSRQFALWP